MTKDNLAPPSNVNKVANSTHQNQPDKGILPKPAQNNSVQVDRKYNLVLYGIGESLKDTPRLQRVEHDLGEISKALTSVVPTFNPTSIKDFHRMGKFNPNQSKPRPLLLKFLRSIDVDILLSKRGLFQEPISIKPDLPYDERRKESFLMKERWLLIQNGTDRRSIKIRNGSIYINNALHGHANSTGFIYSNCHNTAANGPINNSEPVQTTPIDEEPRNPASEGSSMQN